jgi:long-chain acyl-CoA synthetase
VESIESQLTSVRSVVVIGDHDRWTSYDTFLAAGEAVDPGEGSAGGDVALQLYTSGTTGLPKGAMLTNDNLFAGMMRLGEQWRFDDDSVNLAVMPMFHIAGSGWALVGLASGCPTVLHREVDPPAILRDIARFGVTNALFVPAVIQALLATPGVEAIDYSTLRSIVFGASPITDTVLLRAREVFGCELVQVYGLTETTGAITQLDHADLDPVGRPHLLRSCGRPYP